MKKMQQLKPRAIAIGAGGIYPYSDNLVEQCARKSTYGDEFSICRVVGAGLHKRVVVPRNMVSTYGDDLRSDGAPFKFESSFEPRNPEQHRVITESVALLKSGANFLVQSPTGSGKTAMACDIIAQMGTKTIVVVTKEDIKDQWIANIEKILGLSVGKGIGLIQGGVCTTIHAGIVIAFVQSIAKENRYPEHIFREFGFAIWDEVHHVAADHFSQSCFKVPARLRMGLSATPDRKDGKLEVLFAHIGPVLVVSEAIPMIPRIIEQRSPWEIPYVNKKNKNGLWALAPMPHSAGKCGHIIKLLVNHHQRNVMIAQFAFSAYKKGRVVMIQSELKIHLDTLFTMIMNLGVPSGDMGYYVGGLSTSERDYAKGKKLIFCTYAMTADATDIPWADTLIMATPRSDVRQIVGRILREYENKKPPVVFDIIDATSSVFLGYHRARNAWYKSIGAVINIIKD